MEHQPTRYNERDRISSEKRENGSFKGGEKTKLRKRSPDNTKSFNDNTNNWLLPFAFHSN